MARLVNRIFRSFHGEITIISLVDDTDTPPTHYCNNEFMHFQKCSSDTICRIRPVLIKLVLCAGVKETKRPLLLPYADTVSLNFRCSRQEQQTIIIFMS